MQTALTMPTESIEHLIKHHEAQSEASLQHVIATRGEQRTAHIRELLHHNGMVCFYRRQMKPIQEKEVNDGR